MEIELLDAEGQPLPRRADHRVSSSEDDDRTGPPRPGWPTRATRVTCAVGLCAAVAVLVVGGIGVGARRGQLVDGLDHRLGSRLDTTAAALTGPPGPAGAAPDPFGPTGETGGMLLQVLQSPGTVVEGSPGLGAQPMVDTVPPPGRSVTTEAPVALTVDGETAHHRVRALTLPTARGIAGRTVVAAALPLEPVTTELDRWRAALTALAGVIGLGAAVVTRRVDRGRAQSP